MARGYLIDVNGQKQPLPGVSEDRRGVDKEELWLQRLAVHRRRLCRRRR